MKTRNMFILTALAVVLFYFSCTKGKEESLKDFKIENAAQIIQEFNKGKFPHEQGELVEGSVYMRTATDDMMVVFVNNENLGNASLVYQLQTAGLENQNFETSIEKAQILYFRNSLIINSLDKNERYLLNLTDAEKVVGVDGYTSDIKGFGLSRYTISDLSASGDNVTSRGVGSPPPAESCRCDPDSDDGLGCDSGGSGSTSCSGAYGPGGTNCSVSCGSGHHACCLL